MFSKSMKEKGQGLVEYAIILSLVAITVIAVMRVMGPKVCNTFSTINSSLPGSSSSANCGGASAPDPYANTWGPSTMGASYARDNFCAGKPSGTGYNVINVGSGWFVGGGSGTTPGSYPGHESAWATLDSSGVCP